MVSVYKPSRYTSRHPGHLSLAILPCVCAMSTNNQTLYDTPAPYLWSRSVK